MTNKEIAQRLRKIIKELGYDVIYDKIIGEDLLYDLIKELEHPKKDKIQFENRMPIFIPKPKGWDDD